MRIEEFVGRVIEDRITNKFPLYWKLVDGSLVATTRDKATIALNEDGDQSHLLRNAPDDDVMPFFTLMQYSNAYFAHPQFVATRPIHRQPALSSMIVSTFDTEELRFCRELGGGRRAARGMRAQLQGLPEVDSAIWMRQGETALDYGAPFIAPASGTFERKASGWGLPTTVRATALGVKGWILGHVGVPGIAGFARWDDRDGVRALLEQLYTTDTEMNAAIAALNGDAEFAHARELHEVAAEQFRLFERAQREAAADRVIHPQDVPAYSSRFPNLFFQMFRIGGLSPAVSGERGEDTSPVLFFTIGGAATALERFERCGGMRDLSEDMNLTVYSAELISEHADERNVLLFTRAPEFIEAEKDNWPDGSVIIKQRICG